MSPRPSSEKSRKSGRSSNGSPKQNSTVFYGRGGAGNFTHRDEAEAAPAPDLGTPTLKGKTYTTGRGGAGNMAKNDPEHPEKARERQDVDVPHVALEPERAYPVGRGGAGNYHHLTEKERAEAKLHNDRVRADSGKGNNTAREHVRDIASKAKGFFGGHKDTSKAQSVH